MSGTNFGYAMANDFDKNGRYRGKVERKWQSLRSKALRESGNERGLSGADLEAAVMAIAAADSSLVKIEQRGA